MGVIIGFFVVVAGILGGTLSQQFSDEFKAWTPWVVQRLIKTAVNRLPETLQERMAEEWEGHVEEIPGHLGKMMTAAGCIVASRKITKSLESAPSVSFKFFGILLRFTSKLLDILPCPLLRQIDHYGMASFRRERSSIRKKKWSRSHLVFRAFVAVECGRVLNQRGEKSEVSEFTDGRTPL